MDRRFLDAFIDPGPFKLLGRTLYPWCLKYRVRLTAFESPLMTDSRAITPADLVFACKVCAEETLGGTIGWRDKMWVARMNHNPAEFEVMLNAFAGYVMTKHWPKFWEQNAKKSGGNKGIPWPLTVVAGLIANGIPEKRAWDMPECQAIWMNTVMAVSKGADVAVMSPEEEAFMEEEEKAAAAKAVADPAKVD